MTTLQTQSKGAVATPALSTYTQEQVDLIKRTIAKGATDDELKLFLHFAKSRRLDPLAKQIYFQKRNSSQGEANVVFITSIDGYRTVAARTGEYAGSDDPVFDNEHEPNKATVTVYRLVAGQRIPFVASARWAEYYPGDKLGFMWKKMPCTMLAKCAESLALRKAFPEDLGGLHVEEELERPDAQVAREEKKASAIYAGSDEEKKLLISFANQYKFPEVHLDRLHTMMMGRPKNDGYKVMQEILKEIVDVQPRGQTTEPTPSGTIGVGESAGGASPAS